MIPEVEHRRSVAFLDQDGGTWACFLVTRPQPTGDWHGYFSFRPGHGDVDEDEVRTADIFIETSEEEIHEKARGLGRPLLTGLLASALEIAERRSDGRPRLKRRFRALIAEESGKLSEEEGGRCRDENGAGDAEAAAPSPEQSQERLRSLYASYRLDQVAHFICLVEPDVFEEAVDRILEGELIDFRARDRVQFAMMVVEHIERALPLPPFEVWVEDYLAHTETYRLYAHTLHREGRLP